MQGYAVADGRHAVLPDAKAQISALAVLGTEIPSAGDIGFVGGRKVSRAAHQIWHLFGQAVDHIA